MLFRSAINIEAPVHLTSLFLKLDELNTIINLTSGLSFVPRTIVPVYSGTKAFLHSFTLSLRHLLRSKNIEVIEIIPPGINTDLGGKGKHDECPSVSNFIESVFTQLSELKPDITFGFSEAISRSGPEDLQKIFARMNGD